MSCCVSLCCGNVFIHGQTVRVNRPSNSLTLAARDCSRVISDVPAIMPRCWLTCKSPQGRQLPSQSHISLHLLSPFPLPSPSFIPSFPFLPIHSLPLDAGPLNPDRKSGERCKLPQQDLRRSPSRNRMWHLVAMIFIIINWSNFV